MYYYWCISMNINPLLVELFSTLESGKDKDSIIIGEIIDEIEDRLFDLYDDTEMTDDDIYSITEELEDIVNEYYEIIRLLDYCSRSDDVSNDQVSESICDIDKSLSRIESYRGGAQRTVEWHLSRHNMLTASIACDVMNVDISKKRGMQIIRGKLELPPGITGHMSPSLKAVSSEEFEWDGCSSPSLSPIVKTISSIPSNPDAPHVRGTRYEPIIRNVYSHLNGDVPISEYECIPHEKYSYIGASPDGIITEGEHKGKMLEIKCPQPHSAFKDGNTVREEYWHQIQVQLNVCNLNNCDYIRAVVYDSPTISGVLDIMKDQLAQQQITFNTVPGTLSQEIILTMGTVWMDGISGNYIYETPGIFTSEEVIHTRPHTMPVFIRHYFILRRDWLVLPVKRNRHWFDTVYIPQATMVWNEILKARENPSEWMEQHPVNRRGKNTTNNGNKSKYAFDNTVSVFKEFGDD